MSTELPANRFAPPPELLPGEQWTAHYAANRSQGKRAVGGGLHFSNQRVAFRPNVIDAVLGGRAWEAPLGDLTGTGVEPGRFSLMELFSGGLRSRLRLELKGKPAELFVVWSPQKLAEEVLKLLPRG